MYNSSTICMYNNKHAIVSPRLIDINACDGYTAGVTQESPVCTRTYFYVYNNIVYVSKPFNCPIAYIIMYTPRNTI